MAVMYSYSVAAPNPMVIQKSASTHCNKRPSRTVVIMMRSSERNHTSLNTGLQIRLPSTRAKVFEDGSMGIVCYREENGEITCEGMDEGPRFCQRSSIFASNQREAEIIDLLRRSSIQMVEDLRYIN